MCGRPDHRNNSPMQSGGLLHRRQSDPVVAIKATPTPLLLRSHLGQSNKLVSCGAHLHHKSGLDLPLDEGRRGKHCGLSSSLSSPLMIQKLVFKPGEVKGIKFTILKDLKIQGVVAYYR